MRMMPLPTWKFSEVYDQCVKDLIPLKKRSRFQGVSQKIGDLERSYHDLAKKGQAHKIDIFDSIDGDKEAVSGEEVSSLYDSRLVVKSSSVRNIYDRIRLSAPGNICPYCGQSPVRTLDHYLPRKNAKFLSVSPLNLIPCCRDCNHEKSDFFPGDEGDALIHPYYDHSFNNIDWLRAEIAEYDPIALKFSVVEGDGLMLKRAASHFRILNLSLYYATHSAVELINSRSLLENIYLHGGPSAVSDELVERLHSSEIANRNSWQTAHYRELSRSEIFCNGGFLKIPKP